MPYNEKFRNKIIQNPISLYMPNGSNNPHETKYKYVQINDSDFKPNDSLSKKLLELWKQFNCSTE
jgi:hypothetical protein